MIDFGEISEFARLEKECGFSDKLAAVFINRGIIYVGFPWSQDGAFMHYGFLPSVFHVLLLKLIYFRVDRDIMRK